VYRCGRDGELFPRVLAELIGFKGGAGHDTGRRGRVLMGLEALP
jgi:hypothetical protein